MAFKVLIDTNMLIAAVEFKVDIFTELEKFGKPELYTLDLVIKELESLKAGHGKEARNARLVLEIIGKTGILIIKSKQNSTDKELLRLSKDYVVCTLDKELKNKIKKSGGKIMTLRQRRYFVAE